MNFEQLYAPSLKELFVQKLQGMILSGELPMGEKLPSERELCHQEFSKELAGQDRTLCLSTGAEQSVAGHPAMIPSPL